MRLATALWLGWLLYFMAVEAWALFVGGYDDTLTGHAVAVMRANAWLLVLVPTGLIGVAIHLLVEVARRP